MLAFDATKLRALRRDHGIALKEIAARMDLSIAQVQRLERGQRRLTVDAMLAFCDALGIDPVDLLRNRPMVPVIGVIKGESEVVPLTPNTAHEALAPHLVPDPQNLAAVRWESTGMFRAMEGHLMFFRANVDGIPEEAWGQRCILRRRNGSQRVGWLIQKDGQIHVNETFGDSEFNADIVWASPILAVIPPFLAT